MTMLGRLLRSAFQSGPHRSADDPGGARTQPDSLATAIAAGRRGDVMRMLAEVDGACAPNPAIHRDIGMRLAQAGMLDLARSELETALALDDSHPGGWSDLGTVHRLEGRPDQAERCYLRALALEPRAEPANLNLAALEAASGRSEAALDRLRALLRDDASPAVLRALVELLDRLQRPAEARRECDAVLARHPQHGVALAAKGFLLLKREHLPEASLACFDAAMRAGERDAQLLCNRGIALQDLGNIVGAIESYDQALVVDPHMSSARFHRSLARLAVHDFARAWADYETRLASADRPPVPCSLPVWDGSPTRSSLLVYGEQGIGDEIMFASCLPDLLRSCPNVILACSPKLEALFQRSFPQAVVVGTPPVGGAAPKVVSNADRMIAIGSLPQHFRRSLADFPRHHGYLRADPVLCAEYRSRLAELGPGLKVGLSWRGGTDQTRRSLRSLQLRQLEPLLRLPGVRLVNLQYDAQPDEPDLDARIAAGEIVHWQDAIDDYERTAALVASLDVIVSVCTAVIHLAGALGRPTHVMASFSPEWRYGVAGHAMPWYPAVRVERQSSPRQWDAIIDRIRTDLLAGAVSDAGR